MNRIDSEFRDFSLSITMKLVRQNRRVYRGVVFKYFLLLLILLFDFLITWKIGHNFQ